MKKAKVIKQKQKNHKTWMIAGLVLILLLLFATAMPMADIPGFSRISALLGLSQDSMRNLTLSDLAAYAAGVKNNRVSAAQYMEAELGSGLGRISPFTGAGLSGDRLLNAREAYLKEYQETGRYPNAVQGSLSMAQSADGKPVAYDGVPLVPPYNENVPVVDEKRIADGQYGKTFGAPVFEQGVLGQGSGGLGLNLAGQAAASSSKMTLPVKPKGVGQIETASSGGYFTRAMEGAASSFAFGRLGTMGGFNPLVSRINTRSEGGQMGAFGGIGRSYIFSYNAKITGYKVAAKNLAEAAFDGAEAEVEGLITPGEKEERYLGDLRAPNTTINKFQANSNKCEQAKKAIRGEITKQYAETKKTYSDMLAINGGSLPGSCKKSWIFGLFGRKAYQKRMQWNGYVPQLESRCDAIKQLEEQYANACSTSYNPSPKNGCSNIKNLDLLGKSTTFGTKCAKAKNSFSSKTKQRLSKESAEKLVTDALESEITGVKPDFTGL